MPIPSHQNHPRAPNSKPKPSGSIPSQLASNTSPNPLTPLHLNNAFPTLYPFLTQPNTIQPSLFCVKSIPNVSLVSQLQSGKARSCTSLIQCILVHLSLLSIYLFPLLFTVHSLCLIIRYPPFVSLSHPQFPVSIHPRFIYRYALPLSTLL